MKKCPKCKEIKELSNFYKDKSRKDGLAESQRYYRKTEAGKEVQKRGVTKYAQTKKGKLTRFKAVKKYQQLNPEKRKAQSAVNNAIRDGRLKRTNTCSCCGIECIPHGHHAYYSKPLDVTWVCVKCHKKSHSKENNNDS